MPSHTAIRPLDPTPSRPNVTLAAPHPLLSIQAHIVHAHLVLAVSRLLASEAGAHAHVEGDEDWITVSVALPDTTQATCDLAEAWVHWAVHNAGVRGAFHTREPATHHTTTEEPPR